MYSASVYLPAVRNEGSAPAAAIDAAEAAAQVASTPTPMECVEGADLANPCLTPLPTIATPTPIVYTTTTVTVRKYYFFGGQRVAVLEATGSRRNLLYLRVK